MTGLENSPKNRGLVFASATKLRTPLEKRG